MRQLNKSFKIRQYLTKQNCNKLGKQINNSSILNSGLNSYKKLVEEKQNMFYERRLFKNTLYNFSVENRIDFSKDYYQILKLSQKANQAQIKIQFYKLAKQFHPDTYEGNQQNFKAINQAYQILGNQQKKKYYDKMKSIKKQKQNVENKTNESTKQSSTQQQYQQSTQNKRPYYNHSRAQWAKYRQGYKYNNYTQQYYNNFMLNTHSYERITNRFKQRIEYQNQIQKQLQQQLKKELAYRLKVKEKNKKDHSQYIQKVKKLEQQLYDEKIKKFWQSWIGKLIQKLNNIFKPLYDKVSKK